MIRYWGVMAFTIPLAMLLLAAGVLRAPTKRDTRV
jgi:hypothetical protein